MHRFLRLTNATLLLSLTYFYFFVDKNTFEMVFAILLVYTIVMSQLFWSNPVKGSDVYLCDAVVAKITILAFILYTFWKHGFMWSYILCCVAISFYYSNLYSSIEWCSYNHVVSHGLLHYFCFMASFFAFI